jgi:hypothetical protein
MSHNKFLKKYPSLWEPRIGDKVRVIKKTLSFSRYEIGFCGVITHIEEDEPIYLVRTETRNTITRYWVHSKDIENYNE